jgi:hypothetical protein
MLVRKLVPTTVHEQQDVEHERHQSQTVVSIKVFLALLGSDSRRTSAKHDNLRPKRFEMIPIHTARSR